MATSDILRFISVLTSAIHTGSQLSLSFVSGAALLASPNADEATLLTQFRVTFRRGFVLCPPFAAVATLANLVNAFISWQSNDNGGTGMALRFLLAGLCTASLVPFTLLFVVRSEGLLLEKAAERPGEEKAKTPSSAARTRDLIREWARLNYMRTFFPLIGALVSYSAR
ncbi:anthrone oxygenase CPUR_05435 [Colletotrichum spaethianum]|uniref:Anthrone oxygenase CPUR_05435 n=1 Tax=Colletotrichum spaethianum TaxID=700344 RepID=A0AA37PCH3_9PEZI|nr:anthrone oxygenase CPUR_05435 [Colletotrichum spaethianum]GKT49748.1 anthrone oxygenase CPUR_05435 [Colletotrichum spaethianum]